MLCFNVTIADEKGHMNTQENGEAQDQLQALLSDLQTLETYLSKRGRRTYELAQKFLENARRDQANRAYDERQAAMLEYQHYIWHEIAGMVNKLLVAYGADDQNGAPAGDENALPSGEG